MKAIAIFLATVCACGPEYPNGHVLERPRILDVRLEPPQATIGDGVAVDVLVAFPEGTAPEADVSLWSCPADAYWPQGCAGAEDAQRIGDDAGTLEVGEEWRPRATYADPYPVYLVVTASLEADGDEEEAIKRLVVGLPHDDDPPNRNPVLEEIRVEGSGAAVSLVPVVGDGSIEPYSLRTIDGELEPTEEEMFVSWYASCGTLGRTLTRAERLATTFETDGRCTVWAILRDGRGGTDWASVVVE